MNALRPDLTLLKFETYAQYLESLLTIKDLTYINNIKAINQLVQLGYRNTNRIYLEEEFRICRAKTLDIMNPKIKFRTNIGKLVDNTDPGLVALAHRETPNLLKKLSTIIFIVVRMPTGFDVSSYMDYEMSLRNFNTNVRGAPNWKKIFQGTQKLLPKSSDLSFYDMHKKHITHNDSDNYHTLSTGDTLIFVHKGDHKIIIPDVTKASSPIVKRTMIFSPSLGTIVLYDHIVRKPV